MKLVKPLAFGKALTMLMRSYYPSPLGTISLLADERSLLGCYFVGQKYFENGYRDQAIVEGDSIFLADATAWLNAYFAGENPKAEDVVLAPQGTAFQQSVWQVLREIPYGKTMTYGEIAQKIQCASAQAVGGAVGKNPLSVFVPCHRFLGSQGQLTGYAGGLERKRWLLSHEGVTF